MSTPPMSKGAQSWDYTKDWIGHKFWNPNAEPNPETEEDIKGKVVIVTGSNTGIGKEAALQLAKRGAKVIMACRDLEKAQAAMDYIKSKVSSADIEIMKLDLADLQSVRDFVKEFTGKYDHLDILVNNAGYMNSSSTVPTKTKDGFEYHIGVNHLGPFLLTRLLLDLLKKGAPSKIVSVSSSNIVLNPLDLDDLMMEKNYKGGQDPYNVSKLANALCIKRLAFTLESDSGIKVYNVCPGFVQTDIFRNDSGFALTSIFVKIVGLKPQMGCETVVNCAVSKKVSEDPNFGKGEIHRFTKYWEVGNKFLNPEDPQTIKLYQVSEELVGLKQN